MYDCSIRVSQKCPLQCDEQCHGQCYNLIGETAVYWSPLRMQGVAKLLVVATLFIIKQKNPSIQILGWVSFNDTHILTLWHTHTLWNTHTHTQTKVKRFGCSCTYPVTSTGAPMCYSGTGSQRW